MRDMTASIALIIGASRGLGLGLTERLLDRGWLVTATARRPSGELASLAGRMAGRLRLETVDIDDAGEVAALHDRLAGSGSGSESGSESGSGFDLVLVNAGTSHDRWETVADVSTDTFQRVMLTNALSPMRFLERFRDLAKPAGTLAVMSSGQGSITNNTR